MYKINIAPCDFRIIAAYSIHFGAAGGGMEMERCKEAEAWNQIVVHENCSMDRAIQGTQVGHIRGLLEAAVGPEEDMEPQKEVASGKVAGAVAAAMHHMEGSYREEQGEHTQPLQAAREAGSKVALEDEVQLAVVNWTLEADGPQEDNCCCMHLRFCCPGRRDLTFASAHLQSFRGTACFWSLQSHCTVASHL